MECVIVFRNPSNQAVGFISDEKEQNMAVFPNRDLAIAFAMQNPLLRAFPYQIVELEDL